MDENKKVVDVKAEIERMEQYEDNSWLKLGEGRHTVVFVGEPVEDVYKDPSGKVNPQIIFDVQYKQEAKRWSVPKGLGTNGVYYQLCKASKDNGYCFNGLMVNLHVSGKDKNKRYVVLDYEPNQR